MITHTRRAANRVGLTTSLASRTRVQAPDIAIAETIIDRAGLAGFIDDRLDAQRKSPAGRRRQLPTRTLLAALLTLALTGNPLHLRRAWELLASLHPRTQERLGVRDHTGKLVSEKQVAEHFARIANCLDASHHFNPNLDDDQRAERTVALQQFLDLLLDATLPAGHRHAGSYALDATTLAGWARGKSDPAKTQDPDAGWSVKTADGSTRIDAPDVDGKKPRGKRRKDLFIYGYELHALTWVNEEGTPGRATPNVVERIRVFAGGRSRLEPITETLTGLRTAGRPISDIIVDRWYSQQSAPRFAHQVRAAGGKLVIDLKKDQRGPQGTYKGALLIDGNLYCPAVPAGLHNIPDAFWASRKQTKAQEAAAALREPYRLPIHAGPDDDGYVRNRCPATGPNPTVRCPIKPKSLSADRRLPLIMSPPATPEAHACCTQQTITVPPSVNATTAQKHPYGTSRWRESYNRRNRAEAAFADLKSSGTTNAKRDSIRVMGLTRVSVLTALWIAANNLRVIARWRERQEKATSAPKAAPKRRTRTLAQLIAPAAPLTSPPPP